MRTLDTCPACAATFRPSQRLAISLQGIEEEMLSSTLRAELSELVYQRCASCASLIACDARRNSELLAKIYQTLPESYWSNLASQSTFARAFEKAVGVSGSLWDVGCGRGDFLKALSQGFEKHGIEPGAKAVELGKQSGLDLRQGTAASLGLSQVADVVCAIDVMEHLVEPAEELSAMRKMLRPHGRVALFTGDAAALHARLARGRWYYLHCIGHVTVMSRQGLGRLLERVGFAQPVFRRVEHEAAVSGLRWWGRAATNGVRRLLRRPAAAMPYRRDHQLVTAVSN